MNKMQMTGYETEALIAKILIDLGYKVDQQYAIENYKRTIIDMIIHKDDEHFVLEIKKGRLGIEYFRNLVVNKESYDSFINLGYKVILICDKDKVNKTIINNLEKMDIIIWDFNKIIETQKHLYMLPKSNQ